MFSDLTGAVFHNDIVLHSHRFYFFLFFYIHIGSLLGISREKLGLEQL